MHAVPRSSCDCQLLVGTAADPVRWLFSSASLLSGFNVSSSTVGPQLFARPAQATWQVFGVQGLAFDHVFLSFSTQHIFSPIIIPRANLSLRTLLLLLPVSCPAVLCGPCCGQPAADITASTYLLFLVVLRLQAAA